MFNYIKLLTDFKLSNYKALTTNNMLTATRTFMVKLNLPNPKKLKNLHALSSFNYA